MALQGHGLLVEESDLKKAERVGDMPRREPVGSLGMGLKVFFGGCWPL